MRNFTRGFYYGKPSEEDQIYDNNTYIQNAVYIGRIDNIYDDGSLELIQKNKFSVGDVLEIMNYDGANIKVKVLDIKDEYGNSQESAPHPKQLLRVYIETDGFTEVKNGMILRV